MISPFNARLSRRLVPTVRDLYTDGDRVIAFFDIIEFTGLWTRVKP